jgi:hypothetical protein
MSVSQSESKDALFQDPIDFKSRTKCGPVVTSKHRDPSELLCSSQTQNQVETFQNVRDSHGIAESSLDRQSFQVKAGIVVDVHI